MSTAEKTVDDLQEELRRQMLDLGAGARAAAAVLAKVPSEPKNQALAAAASAMREDRAAILEANAADMAAAQQRDLSAALLDRLLLDPDRVEAMACGLEAVAELTDPVGDIMAEWERPNGLRIARVRVPLGVIGIIYESRPNVTADAGALCLKSGNAVILRGGSESFHSTGAIHACLLAGLRAAGLPQGVIQRVPTRDRAAVGLMLTMPQYIDVIVPRGGRGLIERVPKRVGHNTTSVSGREECKRGKFKTTTRLSWRP